MIFDDISEIILLISGEVILISTHNVGFHEEMAKIIWGAESGGSVVERLTPEREVGVSKTTSAVLCP